jgi:DNA polymerase III subunit epsilon
MREIVFDTETTGLSPLNGDRIVEIGCIELENRVETGRHFHCYFNPDRSMPPEAQAVHGLSDAFLRDKSRFGDEAEALLEFLGDAPLIAHNATFDFGFLNAELSFCGRPKISMDRMIDTLAIARAAFPGAKHSLDALCSRFGVDRSHRVLHGALLDSQLLAQVYVELTGGRQIGLELASDAPAHVQTHLAMAQDINPSEKTGRPLRIFTASPEEKARHTAFLATLKDPLWVKENEATTDS